MNTENTENGELRWRRRSWRKEIFKRKLFFARAVLLKNGNGTFSRQRIYYYYIFRSRLVAQLRAREQYWIRIKLHCNWPLTLSVAFRHTFLTAYHVSKSSSETQWDGTWEIRTNPTIPTDQWWLSATSISLITNEFINSSWTARPYESEMHFKLSGKT